MGNLFVKFHDVTFAYDSATTALFTSLTIHIPSGWSGVVGPNGAGKTTLLKLATGLISPSVGYVDRPNGVVYCPQRTDDPPDRFEDFLDGLAKEAIIIKSQLGIERDWADRWETLSHGERKRAQIGVALHRSPEVLAIDEPTNHVDDQARERIRSALYEYRGIGLLISHDRELLDFLCKQCIFIDSSDVSIRKCNYTKGKQVALEEQEAVQTQLSRKKRDYQRLRREAGRRREAANRADQRKSKSGIPKKDHDAKERINAARVTGKDGVSGKLLNQLSGRLAQAQADLEGIKVKKSYRLGIWLPGCESKRNLLLDLCAGSITLGIGKQLNYPRLIIKPNERIGITGLNGTGKSTLLQKIVSEINAPNERVTYIPQEIRISQSREIISQVRALSPDQKEHLMTIVSRLGSRPQGLLESTTPSPGETRKLLLALGMTKVPYVVIMDEPTNHMDLPSIECLEQALSECPCCLVLISHDQQFLDKTINKHWRISKDSEKHYLLHTD